MLRVSQAKMQSVMEQILLQKGMAAERAALCAQLFTQASLDGVYSHGLNRFPRFVDFIDKGYVDIHAQPSCSLSLGALERWEGNGGPGNLNAHFCTQRAIALARQHTIGCVALAHTNHWMRPGTYGLMMAQADCIGILWTNTSPNMPPWGGAQCKIGNNPLVLALPHGDQPLLLDIAMSLASYGKLELLMRQGKQLPFEGGYDSEGNLTKDPGKIFENRQTIPIGYWKGSGLSIMLDLIAALLSGGNSTHEVGEQPAEIELSQVFLAIDTAHLPDKQALFSKVEATLEDLAATQPRVPGETVRWPGAGMFRVRAENEKKGIPVDEAIWNRVLAMLP